MKFFNIDLHISIIADIKTIFNNLGHTIDVNYLSGHSWVFNKPTCHDYVIKQNNWESLDENMCNLFYETHKDELAQYDGFIATYCPAMAMLYEKFNKPIIMVAGTRYEYPFTFDKRKWDMFNNFLNTNNNVIILANNKFDSWYIEQFIDKKVMTIPSLCEYTNAKYNPTKNKSILYSRKHPIYHQNIVNRDNMSHYTWDDLFTYDAMIHYPYNVSTMSIFEQYTANVPLFFPDKTYMMELFNSGAVLNEMSFLQLSTSQTEFHSLADFKSVDPNNVKDVEMLKIALEYSDFYGDDMQYITYFNNDEDLKEKLKNSDFNQISENMRNHNIIRRDKVYSQWDIILKSLES